MQLSVGLTSASTATAAVGTGASTAQQSLSASLTGSIAALNSTLQSQITGLSSTVTNSVVWRGEFVGVLLGMCLFHFAVRMCVLS